MKTNEVTEERARLAKLLEGTTPAPWYWRAHKKADGTPDMPYLYSNTGTRDTVLDSARDGRYGSTLRFKVKRGAYSLMLTVPEMGEQWAAHPDAALIAQAPALAQQLDDALGEIERLKGALRDLVSWFPDAPSPSEWRIRAGEWGADEAVDAARAVLGQPSEDEE